MDTIGSIFSAELISQNIILNPVAETVVDRSAYTTRMEVLTHDFNPSSVRMDQAAGGFSTVVEHSARYCHKVFNAKLGLHDWMGKLVDSDKVRELGLKEVPGILKIIPRSFTFEDNNQIRIVYNLEIGYSEKIRRTFERDKPQYERPNRWDKIGPISQWNMSEQLSQELQNLADIKVQSLQRLSRAIAQTQGGFAEPQSYQIRSGSLSEQEWLLLAASKELQQDGGKFRSPEDQLALDTIISDISTSMIDGEVVFGSIEGIEDFVIVGRGNDFGIISGGGIENLIGYLRLEVVCPYGYKTNMSQRSVDVYAQTNQSTLTVVSTSNNVIDQLVAAGAFGEDNAILKDIFTRHDKVHLIPTIAVGGGSGPSTRPTEFENFDAVVFHVTNTINSLQAITVAIDLKPGSMGIIEDVPHFIGSADYGVITDEFRIERLFRYKWRMGKFLRRYPLSQNIQVKRNSNIEEATLRGYLTMDSLDVVSFEINANTGEDIIKICGKSKVHVDDVQLANGTIIPNDPDPDSESGMDFGNPVEKTWILKSKLNVNTILPSNPFERRFQQVAYEDAYQYIGRPFANYNVQADVIYTRLHSVTKQVFVLGKYPTTSIYPPM